MGKVKAKSWKEEVEEFEGTVAFKIRGRDKRTNLEFSAYWLPTVPGPSLDSARLHFQRRFPRDEYYIAFLEKHEPAERLGVTVTKWCFWEVCKAKYRRKEK